MNKGFTIIETLIAITILMLAIVGPLTISTKALTSAVDAKNQMIATFLAQEAMEYINNIKDNNVYNNPSDWLKGLLLVNNTNCTIYESVLRPCGISLLQTGPVYPDPNNFDLTANIMRCILTSDQDCGLYLGSTGYQYYNSSGAKKTIFKRHFFLSDEIVDESVRVTVVVSWKTGALSNEVRLSQMLTNMIR